jgi:hypothetical protein
LSEAKDVRAGKSFKMSKIKWLLLIIGVLVVILTGCAPQPTVTTTPVTYSVYQLEYKLDANFGGVFWCDPDLYPIARPGTEQANAIAQFSDIQANATEFSAILQHLSLDNKAQYTDEEKLLIYRQHKLLTIAFQMTPADSHYNFVVHVGQGQGERIEGTISNTGDIKITKREPSINTCPICLSKRTLIATPDGQIPVEQIKEGMTVWTLDAYGQKVPAVVLSFSMTPVPVGFQLVKLTLADGRVVTASPGHPVADGRPLGNLHVGDELDGALVTNVERVAYNGDFTYDLLPLGDTGVYLANGIPLKSTLWLTR